MEMVMLVMMKKWAMNKCLKGVSIIPWRWGDLESRLRLQGIWQFIYDYTINRMYTYCLNNSYQTKHHLIRHIVNLLGFVADTRSQPKIIAGGYLFRNIKPREDRGKIDIVVISGYFVDKPLLSLRKKEGSRLLRVRTLPSNATIRPYY